MGPEFVVITNGEEKIYKVKGNETFTISNVNHNNKPQINVLKPGETRVTYTGDGFYYSQNPTNEDFKFNMKNYKAPSLAEPDRAKYNPTGFELDETQSKLLTEIINKYQNDGIDTLSEQDLVSLLKSKKSWNKLGIKDVKHDGNSHVYTVQYQENNETKILTFDFDAQGEEKPYKLQPFEQIGKSIHIKEQKNAAIEQYRMKDYPQKQNYGLDWPGMIKDIYNAIKK